MTDEQKCPHCGGEVHDGTCKNCGASVPSAPMEDGGQRDAPDATQNEEEKSGE